MKHHTNLQPKKKKLPIVAGIYTASDLESFNTLKIETAKPTNSIPKHEKKSQLQYCYRHPRGVGTMGHTPTPSRFGATFTAGGGGWVGGGGG